MNPIVRLEALLDAFEWVSAGDAAYGDCEAFVSKVTGKVHWSGDGVDEELPDDIGDGTIYVSIPSKLDLDLGRSLALRFTETHLPQSRETVHQYFKKRGAYSRFKALLERAGQLEAWHHYEQTAVEQALREWSEQHGLTLVRVPRVASDSGP